MKVLCVGKSIYEYTCSTSAELKEGFLYQLEERLECTGGHAGNIAYLLQKWGSEAYIASMVGSDDAGSKVKQDYETAGVKTDFIETAFDTGTGLNLTIANKVNKSKTIFEIAKAPLLKRFNYNIDPDVVVSDGYDYNASLAAFDNYKNAMTFLSVSQATKETAELSKFAKYLIFNMKSAEDITGLKFNFSVSSSLVDIFNVLKQKYSNAEIIITLGEWGSIYSINGQVKIMPSIKLEVVDSNGAGDAYVGAYVYGMSKNFGLEKSIAYATIAGALSTTKMTSRLSIPMISEVSSYYDTKFGAQNNPNNQPAPTQPATATVEPAAPAQAPVANSEVQNGNK